MQHTPTISVHLPDIPIFADTARLWITFAAASKSITHGTDLKLATASKSQKRMAQSALGTPPILHMCSASSTKLPTTELERMSYLIYQIVVVILLQVTVSGVAKNDVVEEPLQVTLQPVLSTMHQLLSQPTNSI